MASSRGVEPIPRSVWRFSNCSLNWRRAIARIDAATDSARLAIVKQPLGIQSKKFEAARKVAIAVVDEVRTETSHEIFWPVVEDNMRTKLMLQLRRKLDESYQHQLNLLLLWKKAAEAFRSGRENQSPTTTEMASANESFGRILDEMGAIAEKLARYYGISPQEYQNELKE